MSLSAVTWRNWAGNQEAEPMAVERPESLEDLVRVVEAAAGEGRRVKAVGAGHSFTSIAVTDGVQVRLDRYDGLVGVDFDTGLVTVQAGMSLRKLNATLASLGLGLANMGDVDPQTLAGAISTGTHGTGRSSGAIAAQVAGLELVLADGKVVRCSASERPDLFAAARVGLGALGLISTVTLQAEPAFLLEAREGPMPLAEVLDGFDELVGGEEHAELYWFPHTTTALVKRNRRVAGPREPLGLSRRLLDDELLANGVFGLTCRACARWPSITPRVNRLASRLLGARAYVEPAPLVFTSPRRVRFEEMEYAVPRAALPEVVRELQAFIERSELRISFPIEVRVAPADDIWLSTASGRDTAYVAVHVFRGTPSEAYFGGAEEIFVAAGGRPHWGKLHSLGADDLRPLYPRFDDFVRLRDEVDPDRRFANAYLSRVLGP